MTAYSHRLSRSCALSNTSCTIRAIYSQIITIFNCLLLLSFPLSGLTNTVTLESSIFMRLCYERDVLLSVTLVHCDATKCGNGRGRCIGYPHAEADSNRIVSCDPNSTEDDHKVIGYNLYQMWFCTSAAIITASNGSHIALSQHVWNFLFL